MKNYTLGNELMLRLFFEEDTVLPTSPFSQNRIWCFDKLAIEILQSELSYGVIRVRVLRITGVKYEKDEIRWSVNDLEN